LYQRYSNHVLLVCNLLTYQCWKKLDQNLGLPFAETKVLTQHLGVEVGSHLGVWS